MKMTIDVECTPEEARAALGLPDLTPLHDRYVQALLEGMQGRVSPEMVEAMTRSWAPMGEAGLTFWRQLFAGEGARKE
jgi:hypothetical protein